MSENTTQAAQEETEAMAKAIAAALDPEDYVASARALANAFNQVFSLHWGLTAKLILSPLAAFQEDAQSVQNRL